MKTSLNYLRSSRKQLETVFINIDQIGNILLLQKEIPMEMNILAAEYAKQHNVTVVADCGGRDDEMNDDYLKNIDYLSPNQTELQRIIGGFKDKENMDQMLKEQLLSKYGNMKILLK